MLNEQTAVVLNSLREISDLDPGAKQWVLACAWHDNPAVSRSIKSWSTWVLPSVREGRILYQRWDAVLGEKPKHLLGELVIYNHPKGKATVTGGWRPLDEARGLWKRQVEVGRWKLVYKNQP